MSARYAALHGDLDGIKAALENGEDIEMRGRLSQRTALHYACWGGYFSITDFLIQRGADVNSRDKGGSLPIHYACESGHLNIVQLLISKGSDVTTTNKCGNTPFDIASLNGHAEAADYLMQYGAEAGT